ncbi:hypothetical protein [Curvibacter gracilis]|uniref:hypothetical protein n=1 Tax=Curvibacter gracilis TaxID=230310 RepID=UPI0012FA2071|nr:hypothetical protein [Curvibacter gracilis]
MTTRRAGPELLPIFKGDGSFERQRLEPARVEIARGAIVGGREQVTFNGLVRLACRAGDHGGDET